MTNYVQTRICEIADSDFQSLIVELFNLNVEEFYERPLSFMLMAIGREGRALTLQHLPVTGGILYTRVNKLTFESVVHQVCRELARLKGMPVEAFDGKTVLSLIKRCHKVFCPKPVGSK